MTFQLVMNELCICCCFYYCYCLSFLCIVMNSQILKYSVLFHSIAVIFVLELFIFSRWEPLQLGSQVLLRELYWSLTVYLLSGIANYIRFIVFISSYRSGISPFSKESFFVLMENSFWRPQTGPEGCLYQTVSEIKSFSWQSWHIYFFKEKLPIDLDWYFSFKFNIKCFTLLFTILTYTLKTLCVATRI